MYIRIAIYLLLWAPGITVAEVEVTSQRCFINNFAEIWAVGGSLLDREESSVEDQGIGNQSIATNSQARFENVSVRVASQASVTRSNTADGVQLWMDAMVEMRSEGDLQTIGTNFLRTKGFAQSDTSMRIKSSVPFRYELQAWPPPPPLLPSLNSLFLKKSTGHPVLVLNWDSAGTEPPRSQGRLPAGDYDVQLYISTLAEGEISRFHLNPVNGTARSTVSLRIVPEEAQEIRPVIRIGRIDSERIFLEFSRLTPGTHYFLERDFEMVPGPWSVVANFIAAGSEATWVDTINGPTGRAFYRLKTPFSN